MTSNFCYGLLRGASYGYFIAGAICLGYSVQIPQMFVASLVWFGCAALAVFLSSRLRDQ